MKTKLSLRLLALTSLLSIPSFAQHETGNGGDEEIQFLSIATQVQNWLQKSLDQNQLETKLGLTSISGKLLLDQYSQALSNTKVLFTDTPVEIAGNTRICVNYANPARITCNRNEWRKVQTDVRYGIVFHEYLGIAKIETNDQEYSTYPISKNILGFVYSTQSYELRMDKKETLFRVPDHRTLFTRFNIATAKKLPLNLDVTEVDINSGNQPNAAYQCYSRNFENTDLGFTSLKVLRGKVLPFYELAERNEFRKFVETGCRETYNGATAAECIKNNMYGFQPTTYIERIRLWNAVENAISPDSTQLSIIEPGKKQRTIVVRESANTLLFTIKFDDQTNTEKKRPYYGVCVRN